MFGHIIGGAPDADYHGSALTADLAIGDTVLHVANTVDFDENGITNASKVMLGLDVTADGELDTTAATLLPYDTCDFDTLTVTLSAPSTVAAVAGDMVYVLDPATGGPVVDHTVWVSLDSADPNGDALPATLAYGLIDSIGDSDDITGQAVTIEEEDEDDELFVTNISGSARSTGVVKAMQDALTITAAGDQTLHLTYVPMTNSEHLYWNGVYQPGSQWERDKWTVSIADGEGYFAIGDELVMEYLYTDPTKAPPPDDELTLDIPATVYDTSDNFTLPGILTTVGALDTTDTLLLDDGDTSYLQYVQTVEAGVASQCVFLLAFPATDIPGTMTGVSLVTVSRGDANDGAPPYPAFVVNGDGHDSVAWTIDAPAGTWTETVTPLSADAGVIVGGDSPDPEMAITQEHIETGAISDGSSAIYCFIALAVGPGTGAFAQDWTYAALRVTYTPGV